MRKYFFDYQIEIEKLKLCRFAVAAGGEEAVAVLEEAEVEEAVVAAFEVVVEGVEAEVASIATRYVNWMYLSEILVELY